MEKDQELCRTIILLQCNTQMNKQTQTDESQLGCGDWDSNRRR